MLLLLIAIWYFSLSYLRPRTSCVLSAWLEFRVMHFHPRRSFFQEFNIFLELVRLPSFHMRVQALPPKCCYESLSLVARA